LEYAVGSSLVYEAMDGECNEKAVEGIKEGNSVRCSTCVYIVDEV
jgi:hypothetical protein